jgi:hypothetical protein
VRLLLRRARGVVAAGKTGHLAKAGNEGDNKAERAAGVREGVRGGGEGGAAWLEWGGVHGRVEEGEEAKGRNAENCGGRIRAAVVKRRNQRQKAFG